jgi:hypothetical protein
LFKYKPPSKRKQRSVPTLDELTTPKNEPTPKQAAVLRRHGYDPSTLTRRGAINIITRLRANNWKPLDQPKGV